MLLMEWNYLLVQLRLTIPTQPGLNVKMWNMS